MNARTCDTATAVSGRERQAAGNMRQKARRLRSPDQLWVFCLARGSGCILRSPSRCCSEARAARTGDRLASGSNGRRGPPPMAASTGDRDSVTPPAWVLRQGRATADELRHGLGVAMGRRRPICHAGGTQVGAQQIMHGEMQTASVIWHSGQVPASSSQASAHRRRHGLDSRGSFRNAVSVRVSRNASRSALSCGVSTNSRTFDALLGFARPSPR